MGNKSKYLALVAAMTLASCQKDSDSDEVVNTAPLSEVELAIQTLESMSDEAKAALLETPETYTFVRDDQETVSYTGQIFRQILIEDIKSAMQGNARGAYNGTAEDLEKVLYSFISYDSESEAGINGSSLFLAGAKNLDGEAATIAEGTTYNSIQDPGKNLSGKLAGNDNPLLTEGLLGWSSGEVGGLSLSDVALDGSMDGGVEPEDLIHGWVKSYVELAINGEDLVVSNGDLAEQRVSGAYVTAEGLDLAQLVQKFLHGAVSYAQATGDYLSVDLGDSKGLNAQNEEVAAAGKSYTNLEHHWDEAYGYFGAARNYQSLSIEQVVGGLSVDANNDGAISLHSERNFGMSVNSANVIKVLERQLSKRT